MKRILVMMLVLLIAIGLSGCGGDDSSDSGESKKSASSQVVKKTSSDKKKSDDFREMIAKKSDLRFSVDYTIDVDSQGQSMTYKMSQYLGGPDQMRTDMTMQDPGTGEDVKTRSYFLSDGMYSCNDRQGEWGCMKLAHGEDMGEQDYTKDFEAVEENPDDYDITYAGTKSVAGTTAQCWGISFAGQTMKECFSKEGVPLYMEMGGVGMEYVMKATRYSTKVSSSDFELPAEATDMDQMANDMLKQMEESMGEMPEGMGDYE
ncbi:DUF4412 domain-containing protein [Nanoarchaeota archaeon]